MGKVLIIDPREFAALKSAANYARLCGDTHRVSWGAFDQVILGHFFPSETFEQLTARARALRRLQPSFLQMLGDEYVLPSDKDMPLPNGHPPPELSQEKLERLKAHETHKLHRDAYNRTFLEQCPVENGIHNNHTAAAAPPNVTKVVADVAPTPPMPDSRSLILAGLRIADDLTTEELTSIIVWQLIVALTDKKEGMSLHQLTQEGLMAVDKHGRVRFTGRGAAEAMHAEEKFGKHVRAQVEKLLTAPVVVEPEPKKDLPSDPATATQPEPAIETTVPLTNEPQLQTPELTHPVTPPPIKPPLPEMKGRVATNLLSALANHRLLEDIKEARTGSRWLTGAESLAAFVHLWMSRSRQALAALRNNEAFGRGLLDKQETSRRLYYDWKLSESGRKTVAEMEPTFSQAEALHVFDQTTATEVDLPSEPPAPEPPTTEQEPSQNAEIDHITIRYSRIILLHAAVEDATGKPVHKQESDKILLTKYSANSIHSTRGAIIHGGHMTSNGVMGSTGASYSVPAKTRELLKKAGYTLDQADEEVVRDMVSPVPVARTNPPPAPPAEQGETKPAPAESIKTSTTNHGPLVMRLVTTVEQLQTQIDTTQQKLVELKSTREAILATLDEAERAITEQQARLAEHTTNQQTARDAIAALTNN